MGAAVGNGVDIGLEKLGSSMPIFISGTIKGLANGATQSAITGHGFKNLNWGEIAANSFGSALVDELAGAIAKKDATASTQTSEIDPIQYGFSNQVISEIGVIKPNQYDYVSYNLETVQKFGTLQQDPTASYQGEYTVQKGDAPIKIAQQLFPDNPRALYQYWIATNQIKFVNNKPIIQPGQILTHNLSGFSEEQLAQLGKTGGKNMATEQYQRDYEVMRARQIAAMRKAPSYTQIGSIKDLEALGQKFVAPKTNSTTFLQNSKQVSLGGIVSLSKSPTTISTQMPEITNLYPKFTGIFKSSYDIAIAGAANPGNTTLQKAGYFTLAVGMAPMHFLESVGTEILNAPYNADQAVQYYAHYKLTNNSDSLYAAGVSGVESVLGATIIAGPVAKFFTKPLLKAPVTTAFSMSGSTWKVSTGGLRNEIPLTISQKTDALNYTRSLGVPDEIVTFSENMNTSYKLLFGQERLYIGTDVLPATGQGLTANSRIGMRGALAHEIVGHRAAELSGKIQTNLYMEEAQASIRAARFAPDLTNTERITLIRDGLERLHSQGIKIRDVKNNLWIHNME